MGSHEIRLEGWNSLPQPAGHAAFDVAQDMIGFLGCNHPLPGHVELLINTHPQVISLRAALKPFPNPACICACFHLKILLGSDSQQKLFACYTRATVLLLKLAGQMTTLDP